MDHDAMETECGDCGSRFFRAELPAGTTFADKLAVHREMGCNSLAERTL